MSSNITTLPNFKLVIGGGFLLSVNAGFIGALSLAGLHRATVSHVSGDVIRTGVFAANGRWYDALNITLVWTAFIFGSFLSSLMVSGTKQFALKRKYGVALLVEALWLLISYIAHHIDDGVGIAWWTPEYFAAVALGMQNALCTNYSGAVLRTTHMTGCCTDIGLVLGHEFRIRYGLKAFKYVKTGTNNFIIKSSKYFNDLLHHRRQRYQSISENDKQLGTQMEPIKGVVVTSEITPSASISDNSQHNNGNNNSTVATLSPATVTEEPSIMWKLKVLIPLLTGYIVGALLGANAFRSFNKEAILIPMGFIAIIGLVYAISVHTLYKDVVTKMAESPIYKDSKVFLERIRRV